tara:strand:- start:319 stop:477 length:159 start_codon:yes stop_codon:yes gene_type:complete
LKSSPWGSLIGSVLASGFGLRARFLEDSDFDGFDAFLFAICFLGDLYLAESL